MSTWFALFGLMLGGFGWCVARTSIIRVGGTALDTSGARSTYSLSKAQGAFWFFTILGSYLLIGLVTGDFSTSINSTAIILLGIGAGTVLGSAAIDASKFTEDEQKKQATAAEKLSRDIADLENSIAQDQTALDATDPTNPSQAPLVPQILKALASQRATLATKRSAYRKLTGQSEGFIRDILSDANGVNFHRFQMAVWTIVLGIIFIKQVYVNLAMPSFDTTLMGLLGLSARHLSRLEDSGADRAERQVICVGQLRRLPIPLGGPFAAPLLPHSAAHWQPRQRK